MNESVATNMRSTVERMKRLNLMHVSRGGVPIGGYIV